MLFSLALLWFSAGMATAMQDKPSPPPGAQPQVDAARKPSTLAAVIKTARGDVRIELFADKTPLAAANFVNLSLRGFYDGLTFDRIIAKTAVEGGCPLGKGIGFPGYKFEDEFDPKLRHDAAGVVSLLGAGPDTNGCRFTITLRAMPAMDDRNTIFGKATSGMDVVRKLEPGDKIESVRVEGDPAVLLNKLKDRLAEWNKALDEKFPRLKPAPVVTPPAEPKPGG
ncbi:MAG: peptidylprolyl isomerase [Phycisphaerales bacterium]|nr:peptidylprolyl isomerase [Phycisphaerales bacterium]